MMIRRCAVLISCLAAAHSICSRPVAAQNTDATIKSIHGSTSTTGKREKKGFRSGKNRGRNTVKRAVRGPIKISNAQRSQAKPAEQESCLFAEAIFTEIKSEPVYGSFSQQQIAIHPGDLLTYDLYMPDGYQPERCGVDAVLSNGRRLLDYPLISERHDQSIAADRWTPRQIPLNSVAGRNALKWQVILSGSKGPAVFMARRIAVRHTDGNVTPLVVDAKQMRTPDVRTSGADLALKQFAFADVRIASGSVLSAELAALRSRWDALAPRKLDDWVYATGNWTDERGELTASVPGDRQFAVATAGRQAATQVIEARVAPERRIGDSWSLAGICLYRESGSYWRLDLVEHPNKQGHYVELRQVVNIPGIPEPQLTVLEHTDKPFRWEWGEVYRLRIKLSPARIQGEALSTDGEVLWSVAYALSDGATVRSGTVAVSAQGIQASFREATQHVK